MTTNEIDELLTAYNEVKLEARGKVSWERETSAEALAQAMLRVGMTQQEDLSYE